MRGFIFILMAVLIWDSCDDNSNPTGSTNPSSQGTITHNGFDFSTGVSNTTTTRSGETIAWMPGGGTHTLFTNGAPVWWRNSHIDMNTRLNQTKDMGVVDLASVTAAPLTWDVNPAIPPLQSNHAVVAKTSNGYVKFKVVSTDTKGTWPAVVDYLFSTTSSF